MLNYQRVTRLATVISEFTTPPRFSGGFEAATSTYSKHFEMRSGNPCTKPSAQWRALAECCGAGLGARSGFEGFMESGHLEHMQIAWDFLN